MRIKVLGNWFDNLTPTESAERYDAEAYESVDAHKFKKTRKGPERTCAAIKFMCESDVFDDPMHAGFIMPLDQCAFFDMLGFYNDCAPQVAQTPAGRDSSPPLEPALPF